MSYSQIFVLLPIILIAFLGVSALLDIFALYLWSPVFFRMSLPIFFFRYLTVAPEFSECIPKFTTEVKYGYIPPYEFKVIGIQEYAFRYPLMSFSRFPLLIRGIVRFYPDKQTLIVTGRLNWMVISLSLILVLFGFGGLIPQQTILLLFGLLGWIYLVEARRYYRVGKLFADS